MEHEEGPIQWVCPERSVRPSEVDFVEETSLPILQYLVGQGSRFGEPQLEGDAARRAGSLGLRGTRNCLCAHAWLNWLEPNSRSGSTAARVSAWARAPASRLAAHAKPAGWRVDRWLAWAPGVQERSGVTSVAGLLGCEVAEASCSRTVRCCTRARGERSRPWGLARAVALYCLPSCRLYCQYMPG